MHVYTSDATGVTFLLTFMTPYDTRRQAFLTCAQKLSQVSLICRTEPKTKKKWKREKIKIIKRIWLEVSVNSPGNPRSQSYFTNFLAARRYSSSATAVVRCCVSCKSVLYRNGCTDRAGLCRASSFGHTTHLSKSPVSQQLSYFPRELRPELWTIFFKFATT